jgi:hypothetical protein
MPATLPCFPHDGKAKTVDGQKVPRSLPKECLPGTGRGFHAMQIMKSIPAFVFLSAVSVSTLSAESGPGWVTYEPKEKKTPKEVVLLAGDEEYRSEEALPMLAKILSERHGIKSTVVFSIGSDGAIDPKAGGSLAKPEALDSASVLVLGLRFRHYPDDAMKKFEAALNRGVGIVALRTSTHAFNFPKDSPWASWSWNQQGGFGKKVLGETWVTHWGLHAKQATRGVIEPGSEGHPLLKGVTDVFGDTDVYEAYPPKDATILLRGLVLENMQKDAKPLQAEKTRANDKQTQKVNDPAMPVAWSREVANENGSTNRVMTTTMGSASDLVNEGLRRLVVNSIYWGLGETVPDKADVTIVGDYAPTKYSFDGFKKGVKAEDLK